MTGWDLPVYATFDGEKFGINADFRNILKILGYLDREEYPVCLRWIIALTFFYDRPVPKALEARALAYMEQFLGGLMPQQSGPRLFSWEQDAPVIVSEINAVAGREIRREAFVHWWTFLSWFHAIGPGRFSTLVGIRDKLQKGKPLEGWERQFYARNREQVACKRPLTQAQRLEKQRLEAILEGGSHGSEKHE